jgi:NAD(P)-dependent dehydrogenase (short-subunit alcohol dehydrogenase family)
LFSLKDHVIAITGGARGIGLALAFAVAEVGGKVAIIDAAKQPHEHYSKLSEICSQVQYYRCVLCALEEKSFRSDDVKARMLPTTIPSRALSIKL